VTGDANVAANESTNIRNTPLLGQPNPNFPGLSVLIDADMIAPDGTIIPRNTNLANLFNTLGVDDSPGNGVTLWAGWHVLESFGVDVKKFTITASVRDAAGNVGTDVVTVTVDKHSTTGQALTPAPSAVGGDGVDDYDGPEVTLIGPRDPSAIARGTPRGLRSPSSRSQRSIGAAPASASTRTARESPTPWVSSAMAGSSPPSPGTATSRVCHSPSTWTSDGATVRSSQQNFAPAFDIAGSVLDHRGDGRVITTASWVAGGSFIMPEGKNTVTVTARVTDNAGKSATPAPSR
jgi:hypothetical protein